MTGKKVNFDHPIGDLSREFISGVPKYNRERDPSADPEGQRTSSGGCPFH
jgi:hypothetical protein